MPFHGSSLTALSNLLPVTYQIGLFEGHGTLWNLSLTGWRFSGNLPLRIREVCSLTVNLLSYQRGLWYPYPVAPWEWRRRRKLGL